MGDAKWTLRLDLDIPERDEQNFIASKMNSISLSLSTKLD